MTRLKRIPPAAALIALCGFNQWAAAQAGTDLTPIVVIATRVAESSFDVPASVDRVSQAEIRDGQLQENISESLMTVPGVSAESRQNYAQDLQLSVRGFGARSSFGVRGVRLYSDGIPGTMPDGQGQFSQFDLGSADRIEVLRGPFSALYGNSSGGVISIFTEDAAPGHHLDGTAEYGTFNTQRYALKTTGDDGTLNYVIDAVHFQTDGYRFHSSAERDNFNSKIRFAFSGTETLTLVVNVIDTPFVQDREPAPGESRGDSIRHPQVARSGAARRDLREQPERRGHAVQHDLRGPPRNHPVPIHTAGDRGEGAALSGRRDRSEP
jgi:iron complex outermembrane receptor protein